MEVAENPKLVSQMPSPSHELDNKLPVPSREPAATGGVEQVSIDILFLE